MENSIWATQKKSTEDEGVWGNITPEPQQQEVSPNTSIFKTQHVSKPIPIFKTGEKVPEVVIPISLSLES